MGQEHFLGGDRIGLAGRCKSPIRPAGRNRRAPGREDDGMRGKRERQGGMFYVIDLEERVRADHPLRPIKRMVDAELAHMGHLFNKAYSDKGRPSVPPETLLKAMLLQALHAVRSEAQLVERINTDLLFRWFLEMDPAMDVFGWIKDFAGLARTRLVGRWKLRMQVTMAAAA